MNISPSNVKSVFVISHPRSGTHLTIDLIRKQFQDCRSWKYPGEYLDRVYLNLEYMRSGHSWYISPEKALRLLHRASRPVVKTHSLPGFEQLGVTNRDFIQILWEQSQAIYVVRDPRDVLCSLHLWRQEFDPLARCPLSTFLCQTKDGMNWVQRWVRHVELWMNEPKVLTLQYEKIIKETDSTLQQIATVLKLQPCFHEPLLPKRFHGQWHRRWERLIRIHPETTSVLGRYKGRQPLKWKTTFSRQDRELVWMYAGDLMKRLGYEETDAWVNMESSSMN